MDGERIVFTFTSFGFSRIIAFALLPVFFFPSNRN